jgi:hypothetical protein
MLHPTLRRPKIRHHPRRLRRRPPAKSVDYLYPQRVKYSAPEEPKPSQAPPPLKSLTSVA